MKTSKELKSNNRVQDQAMEEDKFINQAKKGWTSRDQEDALPIFEENLYLDM